MNNFKPVYKGQLEMASIRLVKDAPIMSENEIHNAGDAVKLLGEYLCEMDREVLCIINVKTNGIPINCSICSIGVIDQTIAQPRELLKTAILSNAAGVIIMHNHPKEISIQCDAYFIALNCGLYTNIAHLISKQEVRKERDYV